METALPVTLSRKSQGCLGREYSPLHPHPQCGEAGAGVCLEENI